MKRIFILIFLLSGFFMHSGSSQNRLDKNQAREFLHDEWIIKRDKKYIPQQFYSYFKDSLHYFLMRIGNPNEPYAISHLKSLKENNYKLSFVGYNKLKSKYIICVQDHEIPYMLFEVFCLEFENSHMTKIYLLSLTENKVKDVDMVIYYLNKDKVEYSVPAVFWRPE